MNPPRSLRAHSPRANSCNAFAMLSLLLVFAAGGAWGADITPPVLTCPAADIVVGCSGPSGAPVTFIVTATDDVDGALPPSSITCVPASGSTFPRGTTNVTCSATDSAGNTGNCSFNVTVQSGPVGGIILSCPNIVSNTTPGRCDATVTFNPAVADSCDANPTVMCTPSSGSVFQTGPTAVSCSVVDVLGNSTNCSFSVTVNDNQPPALTCPAVLVKLNSGETSRAVNFATPSATDNCPATLTVTCSPASGSTFSAGATTVTCNSTDAAGNVGSCSFTITLATNNAPLASNDTVTAVKNAVRTLDGALLTANDTDADGDTLTVSSVISPTLKGGSVSLSGNVVTYTPPSNFTGGDSFGYGISDGRGGTSSAQVCVAVNPTSVAFLEPSGGWSYAYDGVGTQGIGTAKAPYALDGTWNANNGSCEWDGSMRGAGNGLPGGISSINGILTIEDVDLGSGPLNNRKIYFEHTLAYQGITASNLLDAGLTVSFRARLTQPDIQPPAELPGGVPDGSGIFGMGKGMFGVHQLNNGAHSQIGFSLVRTNEPVNSFNFTSAGLTFNRNVSNVVASAGVDSGPGAATNPIVALDPNVFHEFWITVQTNMFGTNGTHTIQIYIDGATTPQVYNVTAGTGNDGEGATNANFIAMGLNNSAGAGCFDVDFFAYKPGAIAPSSLNGLDPVIASLSISQAGGNVSICWPHTCSNYQLEEATTVGGSWAGSTATNSAVGNQFCATVPMSGKKFYRLRKL